MKEEMPGGDLSAIPEAVEQVALIKSLNATHGKLVIGDTWQVFLIRILLLVVMIQPLLFA